MLAKISKFLTTLNTPEINHEEKISLETACTVLLCEVMRADGNLDEKEQALLETIVAQRFSIPAEEARSLISEGISLSEHATDFYQFTSVLNKHYLDDEKTQIVTLLWQLARVDGNVARIEEHIIKRIADLLHLRHADYIRAKEQSI